MPCLEARCCSAHRPKGLHWSLDWEWNGVRVVTYHDLDFSFADLQIILVIDVHPLQGTFHPIVSPHKKHYRESTCRRHKIILFINIKTEPLGASSRSLTPSALRVQKRELKGTQGANLQLMEAKLTFNTSVKTSNCTSYLSCQTILHCTIHFHYEEES